MLNHEALLSEFVSEGLDHVNKIEAGLLSIERSGQDSEVINAMFRSAHSIKGTAGFFGLKKIVELAHAMEHLLGAARNRGAIIDGGLVDILLSASDKLRKMLECAKDSDNTDISEYIAILKNALKTEPTPIASRCTEPSPKERLQISKAYNKYEDVIREAKKRGQKVYQIAIKHSEVVVCSETLSDFTIKINSIGNVIACEDSNIGSMIFFSSVLEPDLVSMALNVPEEDIQQLDIDFRATEMPDIFTQRTVTDSESSSKKFFALEEVKPGVKEEEKIRVDVTLLDNLINLSSDIVLGKNQLRHLLGAHIAENSDLAATFQNIDRRITELQEKIMRTRMQPLANVFDKLPRLVRDLAKSTGKNVQLLLDGQKLEVDKSIIELLGDPLVHIVRNAVDHGVEAPKERQLAGKTETASIKIKARREGGRVAISISDDGGGIDIENIKLKALQQKFVTQEQAETMAGQDWLNLLFQSGFSTSRQVTDISGRGVGLDIARTNVEKAGGSIEISSVQGHGTTFDIRMPLTLVIVPSVITEAATRRFVIPLTNIKELIRIVPGEGNRKLEYVHGFRVLRTRDKLLPIIHLIEHFNIPYDSSAGIIRVLVIQSGLKQYGLIVDKVLDREDVLIKPLPRHLKECRHYSGVTILGDGSVAAVLDTDALAAASLADIEIDLQESLEINVDKVSTIKGEQQELLLFKCSGPEIYGINLSLVAKVDELDPEQIQRIGDKEYTNYHGKITRIIRPEEFLPVRKKRYERNKLYLISPKFTNHPVGILIERIQGSMQAEVTINEEEIKGKGLLGSTIIENRIVLLVDLLELMTMADPEGMDGKPV